jgi:hypothetical protein
MIDARVLSWLVAALCSGGDPQPQEAAQPASREAAEEEAPRWEFSAAAYYYVLPDEKDLASPVVRADRGPLHLEARYNYEDRDTGSLFAGWNFGLGEELRLDATLMAGVVAGRTEGIAPGYEATLSFGPLDWTSEGEYVIDVEDHEDSFLYSWSELGFTPLEGLRGGFATQRTKAFEMEREVERGLFLGVERGILSFTAYVFNPDDDDAYWVFSLGANF